MKKLKRQYFVWLLLSLLSMASLVWAKEGVFIHGFALDEKGGDSRTLVANVQMELQLSDYLRQALENGVTLRHTVYFELHHTDEWWWDGKVLARVDSELQYHSLSGHYQIIRLDTNEHWNFPSLASALAHLETLVAYELPQLSADAIGTDSFIQIRAVLAIKSPALPLRLRSLFSDEYALESEGVMWPLP